ncbi:hypothetical protein DL98DRAFT_163135 [Cadophora sp. DSE1049]|nr:hypothetical protein DL98DRAFT_163135 [Cadophora sp. DSE1049]
MPCDSFSRSRCSAFKALDLKRNRKPPTSLYLSVYSQEAKLHTLLNLEWSPTTNKQPLFLSGMTARSTPSSLAYRNGTSTDRIQGHLQTILEYKSVPRPTISIALEFNNVADLSRRRLGCTTSRGIKGWTTTSLGFENWRVTLASNSIKSMKQDS